MRRLVHNPMIQYIIINLHTKYDYSILHSFAKIFDEKFHYSKYGQKENWTNPGKNKHEKTGFAISQYNTSLSSYKQNMTTPACMVSQKSLQNLII